MKENELTFEGVTINFIYSFILGKNEIGSIDIEKAATILQATHPRSYDGVHLESREGPPSTRAGVAPYLSLVMDGLYLTFPTSTGIVNGFEVIIHKLLRLCDKGVGAFTIAVEVPRNADSKLSTTDVLRMFKLIREIWHNNDVIKIEPNPDPTVRYAKFQKVTKATTLFAIFKDVLSKTATLLELTHFGQKYLFDPKNNHEFVIPYVVTMLELHEKDYRQAFASTHGCEIDMEKQAVYQKQIAAILYRMIVVEDWDTIDETYLNTYTRTWQGNLTNMDLSSKHFLNIHIRSCVSVCVNKAEDPPSFILPSLLNAMEVLRMRWHYCIMLNAMMDREIQDIKRLAPGIEALDRVVRVRKMLVNAFEDPSVYSWQEVLPGIYEEAELIFRINELEKTTLRKIDMLDRFYEVQKELARMEELLIMQKRVKQIEDRETNNNK